MIHFSHGNGFPAETYHQLIKGLNSSLGVNTSYISCLGHNPQYPVVDCWSTLVDELISHLETNYTDKVIGLGHSLGGVLSYWACQQRPDLFKAILLIDSPVYANYKLAFIRVLRVLGLLEYFTPARYTKNRRHKWASYQEALEHFTDKRVFRYFDPKCLRDYVYFGTKQLSQENNKIQLKFDPMIEWTIYQTIPSMPAAKLAHDVPCGLIYGQFSKVISKADAKFMHERQGFWSKEIAECGHLLPFEKPNNVVAAVVDFIKENNIL